MKRAQTIRLKTTLRRVAIATSCFFILTIGIIILINFGSRKEAKAAGTETLTSGAFIINMGIIPQTYANGLKPYGMIYDLIVNYNIPIKWVINQSKSRDGVDFTYNAVNYSGGPFIIEYENISATIAARITYWQSQGVSGVYTTSSISVPVYSTLTVFPKVTIDTISNRQSIITNYYTNAAIPSTAYFQGSPSTLNGCVDIWTNPHGDPTWATHKDLYNFVTVYKSWVWAGCHSVSVMEGCKDLVAPFKQLNFLTSNGLQCYSGNKCGPAITESHGNSTAPYTYFYPTDPVMQFMSDMHQAASSGSEDWYIPTTTGQWNTNTKQLVNTSDGAGSRKGVKLVYGPAYGDVNNGYVMYESGHDLDGGGTTAQKVSAQRAYFNFLLLGGISKSLTVTSTVPATASSRDKVDISATATGGGGSYTYKWTSLLGAVFASSTQAVTKYHVPNVSAATTDIITITATDNCNRQNFTKKTIAVVPSSLPIKLKSFKAYNSNKGVIVEWSTASEINNDFFSVQRSIDGFNFIEIGRVRGAGNSTILLDYSYTDEHPYNGTSYYRLKQTDYDGKSETFNTMSVNLKEKLSDINEVHIYPNPFSDSFTAEFESIDKNELQIQLLSMSGVIIYNESIMIDEGKNSFHFSTPDNMKTGIYIFRVLNGSTVLTNEKVYCRRN